MQSFHQRHFRGNSRSHERGMTLIELLIAMLIGLFLLGGVISIFVSNQQNYRTNENLSRVQESARFAIEQLGREIRDAGFNPCGVRTVNNVIFQTTTAPNGFPWWANWNQGTIVGYDGTATISGFNAQAFGTTSNKRVLGTDAITILRSSMDEGNLYVVQSHNTATSAITLDRSPSRMADGEAALLCDNNSAAIFHLTSTPSGNDIDYSGTTDFNCSQQLGWTASVNCNTSSTFKQFAQGSFLTGFDPAFWYVGISDTGQGTSLYRSRLVVITASGITRPTMQRQEMVPGVTDMQIEYLTRQTIPVEGTSAAVITLNNDWITASDASLSTASGGWTPTNINQVVAVRVTLTLSSKESVGISADETNTQVIQRTVVAVFSLRNREL
ncbi:MAG: PilW family protein [Brachymonas sp.]